MSLHLEFEPHSWYMQFAIRENNFFKAGERKTISPFKWSAFTDNGNTGFINRLDASTLKDLKTLIRDYHLRNRKQSARNYYAVDVIKLRGRLDAETISWGELSQIDNIAKACGITVTNDMTAGDTLTLIEEFIA